MDRTETIKPRTKRVDLRKKGPAPRTKWEIYEERKKIIYAISDNVQRDLKELLDELGL
ncbi:MAG TPA: hypothetical protein PKX57_10895 [Mesotoga sp.]|nr:hypothetical protein [Mesotoga sp.]